MNMFGGNNNKALADFKDPFNKDSVETIMFYIRKGMFDRSKISYSSTVSFKNGNTQGTQNIESDNFIDLVKKTEEFIKSL